MDNKSPDRPMPSASTVDAKHSRGPSILKRTIGAAALAASSFFGHPAPASGETITPPQAAAPSADQPPVTLTPGGAVPTEATTFGGMPIGTEVKAPDASQELPTDTAPLPGGAGPGTLANVQTENQGSAALEPDLRGSPTDLSPDATDLNPGGLFPGGSEPPIDVAQSAPDTANPVTPLTPGGRTVKEPLA